MPKEEPKADILQGTLDLMVLRTLETMGPQHGFGLAVRIQQISDGALDLNQGTLYPALLRLDQRGWIRSRWGVSENNRKAKFYEITAAGRRQIARETQEWARTVAIMERFLRPVEGE
jgi:PadR family transcriptional regulator PadR